MNDSGYLDLVGCARPPRGPTIALASQWSSHVQVFSRRSTPEIGVDELDDLLRTGSVRLLDVREDWEYRRGRVPGAVSVPLGRLTSRVATLPRDKPYAVICESGSRSLSATDFLLGQGFEGAVSVKGGTGAWARTRRPMEGE
jgi:rhodanese-related sulfurtransferase